MNSRSIESQGWARGRWLAIIGIVLVLQLGIIFWLANHGTPPAPPVARIAPPHVLLPGNTETADSPGSSDPLFFVRANPRSFSGPAWMQTSPITFKQPAWSDPAPPSNGLPTQQLGASLDRFLQTNLTATSELAPEPKPAVPPAASDDIAENTRSTLSVEGALAQRPLLSAPKLESWPATETTEILSNTVVQTGVDEEGNVFSALLVTTCGSKEADASALALARAARFQPLNHDDTIPNRKTWGQMVFRWRTVPMPATNPAAAKP